MTDTRLMGATYTLFDMNGRMVLKKRSSSAGKAVFKVRSGMVLMRVAADGMEFRERVVMDR